MRSLSAGLRFRISVRDMCIDQTVYVPDALSYVYIGGPTSQYALELTGDILNVLIISAGA